MGFTQTVVATFAVVLLIVVTMTLNESVFTKTDLSQPIGKVCDIVERELKVTDGTDVRELLYGTLSVRGANISALVLGVVAFGVAFFSKSLDLEMESKYQEASYMLYGKPRAYIAGILFRLCAVGTALAMTLSTLLIVPVLAVESMDVVGANRSLSTAACDDQKLGPNQLERFDLLSVMLVLSASSVAAVGFMVYAIKYDAKASAE